MKIIVSFLVLTALFSLGCSQSGDNQDAATNGGKAESAVKRIKPERDSKVVARVNGVPIYEDELSGRSIDTLITEEILYQDGLKRGLLDKYENQVMAFQMSLIVNDVKKSILEQLPPEKQISEESIEKFYSDNITKYRYAHLEEINFHDKSLGEEIKQMAAAGKELQEIADKYSESGTEVTVRDLGNNKKLLTHFSTKENGSITDVIEKQDGTFSVLRIVEIKETPLEHSKAAIRSSLKARRKATAFKDYARKVAEENGMKIEIVDDSGNSE